MDAEVVFLAPVTMKEHGDVVVDQEVAGLGEHIHDWAAAAPEFEAPLAGAPLAAFLGVVHLRLLLLQRSGPDQGRAQDLGSWYSKL